jgi:tetratricopeptide (TPR) repeat protein
MTLSVLREAISAARSFLTNLYIYVHCFCTAAMAYLKLKQWDAAVDDATNAIELDRTNVKAYRRRSAAYKAQGKLRAALRDLNLAQLLLLEEKKNGVDVDPILANAMSKEREKTKSALIDAVHRAPKRKVKISSENIAHGTA